MSRSRGNQYINQGVNSVFAIGEDVTTSICGTGSTSILRFDTTGAAGAGLALATTAALGTTITITRAGLYHCSLTYATTAGGAENRIGITVNTDAAGLTGTVGMATTGIGDYASTLSAAATNAYPKLTFVATITRALAVAGAVIRFHASDAAAGTPAVGDLTEAECRFEVHLVGNVI